ncbi:MAG: class I SAM-dependent methyltransferase [Candidatus Omnitrophica bacterium]|nr:class I SAM-dependent methyltransferase [Candidatus Omnitrophota bacterium]
MIKEIKQCRICGNPHLQSFLHLGEQTLTGVFPRTANENITKGPLELVKCMQDSPLHCGLVQLKHSYELSEMYGENYGYRSGLNRSMVEHLGGRVRKLLSLIQLSAGDLVIDIGSNDSTLLQSYQRQDLQLVGIDPTGVKFKEYYPSYVDLIPDFFSAAKVKERLGSKKAKVITSIAMFYDLESPTDFMREIYEVLDDNGLWVFEQSYMPTMLEKDSYDTVCHEHLEYYAFEQIKWMADKVGFKVVDVEFNAANGGSFAITVAKQSSRTFQENTGLINAILADEKKKGLSTIGPFSAFTDRISLQKDNIIRFLRDVNQQGKKILGYGASTKGNVILQYCSLTARDIPYIAEVNPDKFGRFTPGTVIPIISEQEAHAMKPDYFLVLPWHFKDNIIQRERAYLDSGGALVFPLPQIEVISKQK